MTTSRSSSCGTLIIGGGVVGLSLAWELGQRGEKVCVVDRGQLGQEASWAGAGMIPAAPAESHWKVATPLEQLEGLSQRLHPAWHGQLRESTGVDTEYRQCGALYLATNPSEAEVVQRVADRRQYLGIACEALDGGQIAAQEPVLASQANRFVKGYSVPSEAQFRSPRLLQALTSACQMVGVTLRPGTQVERFASSEDSLTAAVTSQGIIHADRFCLTAGCWSGQLAQSVGIDLPVRPIRGQIILVQGPPGMVRRNLYVGMRYFTPRLDGRLLVGSTLEDAGFHKVNTVTAVADLTTWAASIAPATAGLPIEHRWAGLRPGTADNRPYLGRLPRLQNAWIATGHFRAGLQLAPATAVVMRSLICGEESPIDVSSFGVERELGQIDQKLSSATVGPASRSATGH
ncbi:MAG: glycine oxidase ThiO [Pirellulales bacterium]|nr:glycine oxidase ThiO [Pirellulales bacterium]